jgi:hypothetical protein
MDRAASHLPPRVNSIELTEGVADIPGTALHGENSWGGQPFLAATGAGKPAPPLSARLHFDLPGGSPGQRFWAAHWHRARR